MLRIPMRAREMESSDDEDEDEVEDEGLTLLVAACAVMGGGKGDLDDEPICSEDATLDRVRVKCGWY